MNTRSSSRRDTANKHTLGVVLLKFHQITKHGYPSWWILRSHSVQSLPPNSKMLSRRSNLMGTFRTPSSPASSGVGVTEKRGSRKPKLCLRRTFPLLEETRCVKETQPGSHQGAYGQVFELVNSRCQDWFWERDGFYLGFCGTGNFNWHRQNKLL